MEDLGGKASLSSQQTTLIELAGREKFVLDSVDAWIFVQPSLINARSKSIHPVVLQRQVIADSLKRTLQQLGIKRVVHKLDLAAALADIARQENERIDREKANNNAEQSGGVE